MPLLAKFECDKPGCAEVVDFLRTGALREQDQNFSTTFVFVSGEPLAIDAYLTVSAASVRAPRRLRERLGTGRPFIPALMIDFVAVAKHRDGQDLGIRIFEWLQSEAQDLNATAGVRFIVLGVRARNWGAYRIYVKKWGFEALPVPDPNDLSGRGFVPPPDPDQPKPAWMEDEDLIHLFYDLVEKNGTYVHVA